MKIILSMMICIKHVFERCGKGNSDLIEAITPINHLVSDHAYSNPTRLTLSCACKWPGTFIPRFAFTPPSWLVWLKISEVVMNGHKVQIDKEKLVTK